MTQETLTGTLLEFGKSFWKSEEAQLAYPGLVSSNIVMTGRYGIGFFSSLMISSEVTVTTRQYLSEGPVQRLDFRDGLELRPLLLTARVEELEGYSTRLDIAVNTEQVTNLLSCCIDPAQSRLAVTLRDLVAHLCPSLDCDVYTQVDHATPVLAHSHKWFEADPEAWLRDILLMEYVGTDSFSEYVRQAASFLEVIRTGNGDVIGRAAIGFGVVAAGLSTLGGLTSGFQARNVTQFSDAYVGYSRDDTRRTKKVVREPYCSRKLAKVVDKSG